MRQVFGKCIQARNADKNPSTNEAISMVIYLPIEPFGGQPVMCS
jgi:hypothetical protein